MSRSRPASNPISYHKHTNQYYVTRGGKRVYLGSDKDEPINRYHKLGLGFEPTEKEAASPPGVTVKDLANRFIAAQQANWRNPKTTLKCYKDWLGVEALSRIGMVGPPAKALTPLASFEIFLTLPLGLGSAAGTGAGA